MTAEEDYGIDMELRPGMPTLTGPALLIRDVMNSLDMDEGALGRLTPEGTPWDKAMAGRGYNLKNLINAKMRDPSSAARRIEVECLADDRVLAATVETSTNEDGAFIFDVSLVGNDGPFRFTIRIDQLNVTAFYNGLEI